MFGTQNTPQTSSVQLDPLARRGSAHSFASALLATALFRCWHIILFFTAWATAVTLVHFRVHHIDAPIGLLTVVGTVLGFVISYRTTSSFERYNEGRRLWSQIILGSRTFARLTWFHLPDAHPPTPGHPTTPEHLRARALLEKKTIINLLEAFAVSVKHYLRGEDSIYYTDLHHLVKFLPAYQLPGGIPSAEELGGPMSPLADAADAEGEGEGGYGAEKDKDVMSEVELPPPVQHNGVSASQTYPAAQSPPLAQTASAPHLPMPVTSPGAEPTPTTPRKGPTKRASFLQPPPTPRSRASGAATRPRAQSASVSHPQLRPIKSGASLASASASGEDGFLLPARMPPRYSIVDLFPFSLFVRWLTKKGKEVKGRKAARLRARTRGGGTHNLPLEISLYLSSYIAAVQQRKTSDVPTINALFAALLQLTDALTGLERILTTPIPFSYAIHLWVVCIIYNLMLPFQIVTTFKYLTIPATTILSFVFFGFLVAGEEIENPFGYDKNDLNMDHFTRNIIRAELRAITAFPAPDPGIWAFAPRNDCVFAHGEEERASPEEWVARGVGRMQGALALI